MRTRPAQAQDQATITAMVRGAHLNPIDLRWQRFLVAVDETGIVGAVQIRPSRQSVRVGKPGRAGGSTRTRRWQPAHSALIAQSPRTLYLFCRPQLKDYYARSGFAPSV